MSRDRRRWTPTIEQHVALIVAWYDRHQDDRGADIPDVWSDYMRVLLNEIARVRQLLR